MRTAVREQEPTRVKISLPWQSGERSNVTANPNETRSFVDTLTSPLGRAIAGTLGFFFLRLGVNAHSGPLALAAWTVCALLFWFCFSGRLPFLRRR